MGFVWFLLGLIVGGMIGLTIMCLFQINRLGECEPPNLKNNGRKKKVNSLLSGL